MVTQKTRTPRSASGFRAQGLPLQSEDASVGASARLVQAVGQRRAFAHPLKRIAAAVGEDHGLLGVTHRAVDIA